MTAVTASQTQHPLTNVVLATQFITENGRKVRDEHGVPELGLSVTEFGIHYGISHVVDIFMTRFPRGRGVKGNDLLARFYAACRTIKIVQSTPRSRLRSTDLRLSETEQKILVSFTGPEQIRSRKDKTITGSGKFYDRLIDKGILGGYYRDDGRAFTLTDAWLTDFGIRVRDDVIALRSFARSRARRSTWFDSSDPTPKRVLAYHRDMAEKLRDLVAQAPKNGVFGQNAERIKGELDFHEHAITYLENAAALFLGKAAARD